MRIESIRVFGFQSFSDSGVIGFTDGINLVVGQNNAGKSALLRAMQPGLADDRHRTPAAWDDSQLAPPEVQIAIVIGGEDLRREVLRGGQLFIPFPEGTNFRGYANDYLDQVDIPLLLTHRPGTEFSASYPSHRQFDWNGQGAQFSAVVGGGGGRITISHTTGGHDSIPHYAFRLWNRDMFYFSAERMNVGESAPHHVTRLVPNASNLPAVLLTLAGDRGDLFQRLIRHLREIFPTVGNLSVRPRPDGNIEVRVWPTEAMERVELSFPLLQSGTGVAQVISILTAVLTVDHAVLIIDEMNSFLHPAAVKGLLRILQTEYTNHQYIISTHAPEVISFSNPRTVHLLKRNGYESTVKKLNLGEIDAFREVAEHLGVSMSDVFAADRIIWVEGPTEELCFPLLYGYITGNPIPRGTIFTSVMATGDFLAKRRDRELIYQIYKRLSQTAVPLVVSFAFSFDSENLSDSDKSKMVEDSRGAMHFLPRRLIECYLINPLAIADFISERDTHVTEAIDAESVAAALKAHAESERFMIEEWAGDLDDPDWLARVDAANLIATTCAELSEHRVTFNKKDDTLALLRSVQAINPDQLSELSEYVHSLVRAVV